MSIRIWKHPDAGNDSIRYQFDGEDGDIFECPHGQVSGQRVDHVPADWIEMSSPYYNPNHDEDTSWSELPDREPGVATVEVAGVAVHTHVRTDEDDRQRLVVAVDTDRADSMLRYRRDVVTMDVMVQGNRIWTDAGRDIPTLVSPQVQFVAGQVVIALDEWQAAKDAAAEREGSAHAEQEEVEAVRAVVDMAGNLANMVLDPRDTIGLGCHCTDDLAALAKVLGAMRRERGNMQELQEFVMAVDKAANDWQFTCNLAVLFGERVESLHQHDREHGVERERPLTFLRRLADLDQLTPEGDAARRHYGTMAGVAERARDLVPMVEAWR